MSSWQKKKNRQVERNRRMAGAVAILAILGILAPLEAQAYVGPGAGITAIGTFLAFMAGLLFAVVGFVWYPIKRLRRKRQQRQLDEVSKP